MNLDLLDQHYKRAENRARSDYAAAATEAAQEWHRGVLSPEEMASVLEQVEQLESSFYDAQLRHTAIFIRRMVERCRSVSPVILARILARLTAAHRPLEVFTHRASNDHTPPLARLAHSINPHGPPRRRHSSQALRLSVLTM